MYFRNYDKWTLKFSINFSQVNGDFVLVENVKIPYPGE